MPGFINSQTFQTWVALGVRTAVDGFRRGAPPARADSRRRAPTDRANFRLQRRRPKAQHLRLAEEERRQPSFATRESKPNGKIAPSEEIFAQVSDAQLGASKHAGWKSASPNRPTLRPSRLPVKLVLRIISRPRGLVPEVFGVAYLSQDGQGAYCDVFVEPMVELQRTATR